MPGTYLDNALDYAALKLGTEPIPAIHREAAAEPIIDVADPVGASGACASGGIASVLVSWRKTAGLATAKLDLQILIWDPVSDEWIHGDTITNVAFGQAVVFPTTGSRFFVKIVGVTDVGGITLWQLLVRPWDRL